MEKIPKLNRHAILNTYVNDLTMDETVAEVERIVEAGVPTQHVVVNASKVNLMEDDPELRSIVNECPLINADGASIVWAARILGIPLRERVTGIDLFLRLVELAPQKGWGVYLFGAKEEVVRKVKSILEERYPGISIVAVLFAFPLYWIITGSFKTGAAINSTTPEWWPSQWVLTNYQKLFAGKSAPLWQLAVPFSHSFSADGEPIYFSVGPTAPAALRWMINTVFMAVMSMILTCITAAMAGYALAKKRFVGRRLLFTLIVCAMALPKQVILIPLLREMSALNLYNTIWAVIFPIVGWPFGVFLMKQFSEGIPTEMLEAARIDGASEARTFVSIVLPMVKPGIGALAIFTFINSWNDYFMQLIMLSSTSNLTISLGIAKLQAENSTDFGLIMAGAALAAVPIIIIFLIFQKYFTKGIAMGAVKG